MAFDELVSRLVFGLVRGRNFFLSRLKGSSAEKRTVEDANRNGRTSGVKDFGAGGTFEPGKLLVEGKKEPWNTH